MKARPAPGSHSVHLGRAPPAAPARQCSSARSSEPGSPRSARCSQLKSLHDSYAALCAAYRSFMLRATPNLFDADFARQFGRFTSAYDVFARHASLVFASVHPRSGVPSVQRTSALAVADDSLKGEWVGFIERLNRLSGDALRPHHAHLEAAYRVVFAGMDRLRAALAAHRLRTDYAWVAMEQLQAAFASLKAETDAVFARPPDARFAAFDGARFRAVLTHAVRLICRLLDHFVGRLAADPGQRCLTRADLVTAASAVGAVMASAEAFDPLLYALKKALIAFNSELALAHARLRLRYSIAILVEEDGDPVPHAPEATFADLQAADEAD